MWPKQGTERREGSRKLKSSSKGTRKGGVGSDQGGADLHLIDTAQCPRYGQMPSTGSCSDRQTALSIVKSLATHTSAAAFPDTYCGGKLLVTA